MQVFYKLRNVAEKVSDLLKQDFRSREIANVLSLAFKVLVKAFRKVKACSFILLLQMEHSIQYFTVVS